MVVGGRELIDTLWNVNLHPESLFLPYLLELIDTLWNVNTVPSAKYTSASTN